MIFRVYVNLPEGNKKTLVFDFGTFVEKGDFDWAVWHARGTWSRDDVHPFHGPTSAAGSLLPGPKGGDCWPWCAQSAVGTVENHQEMGTTVRYCKLSAS